MRITNILALTHKLFRKIKLNRLGGNCAYFLNKTLNRPHKAIMNVKDLANYLNSIHKNVKSSAICENEMVFSTCDLQIIMPVYNTSKFLRASINSVLSQVTNYKFHLVIVNDGSTDDSGNILSEYSSDVRVTIIKQENKGISAARNAGLKKIFGRYLTFIDSDDILAPNAISSWLNAAYKYDADVVEGSFKRVTPEGRIFGEMKWNKEASADKSKMQGYAWLKIYKAELWRNIQFPVHYWYEDTIICGLIPPKVKTYVQIPDYVYYYTINIGSISFNSRGKNKILDNIYITKSVLHDAKQLGYIDKNYEYYYRYFLSQTHTNWDRAYLLGPDIEFAIFRVTCELFDKYFSNDIKSSDIPVKLVKALREKNFNLYRYSNLLEF